MEAVVSMIVDYEGPLASRVAGDLWSGLSKAALGDDTGYTKTTAVWDSLRDPQGDKDLEAPTCIFVVEQDLPEVMDSIQKVCEDGSLYGLVLAVPDPPSPLAGSLLYQGVERLKESGVRAANIEPALLRANTAECERYAGRLLERLKVR